MCLIRVQLLTCAGIALNNNDHKWSQNLILDQSHATKRCFVNTSICLSWLWWIVVMIGLCMCGHPPLRDSLCSGQRSTSGTCTRTWLCDSRGKCHSPSHNTWPHSCQLHVKSGCTHAQLCPLTLQETRQKPSAQVWLTYKCRIWTHFDLKTCAVQARDSRYLPSTQPNYSISVGNVRRSLCTLCSYSYLRCATLGWTIWFHCLADVWRSWRSSRADCPG